MIAHAIFFYLFSIIAIVSAKMVTASKNTVHSVFFLILDFISISCLFIMIGAEFLGMIMLIVYVGAVAVLFLFVVMMLNVAQQKNQWFLSKSSSRHIPVGLIISAIIFFELIIVVGGWKYKPDLSNSTNNESSPTDDYSSAPKAKEVQEYLPSDKLKLEKEHVGFYLSDHPLKQLSEPAK